MFQKTEKGDLVVLLYILPNAPKNQIIGPYQDALKIKIHSPPIDGKANSEIIKFFSKILKRNKSEIQIISGELSKKKKLFIKNMTEEEFKSILNY